MQITVILVNYHSEKDLLEAIDSLQKSTIPKNFERKIVVVDNESTGELKEIWGVEIIRSKKNLGFTGANNLAIKSNPKSDYFLLLNPDTKVSKDFLTELIKPFINNRHPGTHAEGVGDRIFIVGLASPKIYFYPGYEFHKNRYQKSDLGNVIWYGGGIIDWENVVGSHKNVDVVNSRHPGTHAEGVGDRIFSKKILSPFGLQNDAQQTDFATGCCMLISKQVISKIGLLDEKLFFSWEDTDYSIRAKRAGFAVVYMPNSIIWHKNANTSGGAGSKFQDFYQTRNRLIFAFKYAKPKVKFLLLWQLLRTADLNRLRAILSAFI